MSDWMFRYWPTITLVGYIFSFLTAVWIAFNRKERIAQRLLFIMLVFLVPLYLGALTYWIVLLVEKAYRKHHPIKQQEEVTSPQKEITEEKDTSVKQPPTEKMDLETFRSVVRGMDFYQKIQRILKYYQLYNDYDEHFDKEDESKMLYSIDSNLDNCMVKLKNKYSQLSYNDIRFLAYYIIALKMDEIAIVIEKNRSTIYRTKKKIQEKLEDVEAVDAILTDIHQLVDET